MQDVICRKTYRLRGQAWVVFERPEDAKNALHAMQGFPFFDKPIVSDVRQAQAGYISHVAVCCALLHEIGNPPEGLCERPYGGMARYRSWRD